MTWYLVLIWLSLFGYSNSVITKRSNPRQQNFEQYEIQTFQTSAPASPLANIIDAIATPLNILSDRLTRQPIGQQFNPGYGPPGHQGPPGNYGPPGQYGPPGHYGPPPPHHRPHGHRGNHHHHGQQHHSGIQYPPPPPPPPPTLPQSLPSFLNILPSREQFNSDPSKINPQNPFLNKNPNSEFPRQPGSQFPQNPNFSFGQNYPKPGFSNYPGNGNLNTNENNFGNTGSPCIGFCELPQSQPQRPNQFGNNGGFNGNNFGGPPNNVQANNGFGTQNTPSAQGNGFIQSTFGGIGTDGNQTPQSPATNQFGSGGFLGVSSNTPQNNNNGLIQTTFGGLNPQPQSQPPWPPVNNSPATQNGQNNSGDLIQSTFPGFEPGQLQPQPQATKPSKNDDLISSIFGSTERPQTNNQQNPTNGPNGIPISQPQTQPSNPNENNGVISSIFAGLPIENPPSDGNDLIGGVFPGIGIPTQSGNVGNSFESTTAINAEMKANNDLIDSIFSGLNDGNGQSNVVGTTTIPPSTTNSNGLIYDIDVRSS